MKRKLVSIIFLLTLLFAGYYLGEVLYARSHTEQTVNRYLEQVKITWNELSDRQREIFLTVQDPNFYGHKGVELFTPGSGWTTITQSLAKKFYFKAFREGLPKIKQTLCARFALHPLVAKETQLTLFLNMMYFGNGQYGIADAAAFYYGKAVAELSETEYLELIACLVAPESLNVRDNPEGNRERVERIRAVLLGEYRPRDLFDIYYNRH